MSKAAINDAWNDLHRNHLKTITAFSAYSFAVSEGYSDQSVKDIYKDDLRKIVERQKRLLDSLLEIE